MIRRLLPREYTAHISKFFSIRILGDFFIIKFERTLKESSPPTRIPWKKSYGILKDPLRIFKDSLANLRILEDSFNLQGISKDPYAKKLTDVRRKREIPVPGTPIDYVNIYTSMNLIISCYFSSL